VEDINFSPTESEVFASCGVDGTIQIVDMRVGDKKKSQLKIDAHECDINVISWNKKTANLIASGGDDGAFKVWDIRFSKVNIFFGQNLINNNRNRLSPMYCGIHSRLPVLSGRPGTNGVSQWLVAIIGFLSGISASSQTMIRKKKMLMCPTS
jgi:WD40 repeat protein